MDISQSSTYQKDLDGLLFRDESQVEEKQQVLDQHGLSNKSKLQVGVSPDTITNICLQLSEKYTLLNLRQSFINS